MKRAARFEDQRGVALVLAMFALVVMSALVAASFVAGRLEQQTGRNTLFTYQAAEAAEAGLADALITVSAAGVAMPPVGGSVDLDTLSFAPGFRVRREMSRLTPTLVLVRSAATRLDADRHSLAVRVVGALLRLASDSLGSAVRISPLDQRGWTQLR